MAFEPVKRHASGGFTKARRSSHSCTPRCSKVHTGPSHLFEVTPSAIVESTFDPQAIGIVAASDADIRGGDVSQNAALFKTLFSNQVVDHRISDLVCLNAGAAAYCYGRVDSIGDGFTLAQKALKSGEAWEKYLEYQGLSRSLTV